MVHRNAGVDPRFRVVEAPLDLSFALVWDEFTKILTKGASFRSQASSSAKGGLPSSVVEEMVG